MFDTTRGRGLFHTTFGHVRDKQSVADLIGVRHAHCCVPLQSLVRLVSQMRYAGPQSNIEGLCPGTKLLLTYTPEKAFGGATVTTQDATVPQKRCERGWCCLGLPIHAPISCFL